MKTVEVGTAADVGPMLREVRRSEDITQAALAAMAGVGRQWLNALELGDKPSAPIDMLLRVATVLEVTLVFVPLNPESADKPVELVDLEVHLRSFDRPTGQ